MASSIVPTERNRIIKRRPGGRLTAIENLAINMVYMVMGQSRYNRTAAEYADIASRLPHPKELHYRVNECLRGYLVAAKALGHQLEFCRFEAGHKYPRRFKAGHERTVIERYPDRISRETIRKALIAHGFRVSKTVSANPLKL